MDLVCGQCSTAEICRKHNFNTNIYEITFKQKYEKGR